jgi:flagellar biosynthesis/type III secretory pathway protein FliH
MTAAEKLIRRGRQEGHKEGRQEGHKEGRQEGQCDLLLKQMRLRFGTLPVRILARIRNADPAQLERWAERILTAPTLDAVLDDAV